MLWGFLNTLQIISYFPYLTLYMPMFLEEFIGSLTISNLQISFKLLDDAIESLQENWIGNNEYEINSEDQKYKEDGISSMSVIRNATRILKTLFQGLLLWIIFYALKAKFITVADETQAVTKPEDMEESPQISSNKKFSKCERVKAWLKKKLVSIWNDYKFHFFIRLGFQVYLEGWLLVLLNLSAFKFVNWIQIVSYITALICFVSLNI